VNARPGMDSRWNPLLQPAENHHKPRVLRHLNRARHVQPGCEMGLMTEQEAGTGQERDEERPRRRLPHSFAP
jgi:hypothetical protein